MEMESEFERTYKSEITTQSYGRSFYNVCVTVQSDPDLGTPSGERLLSTKSGSNKVNFLYRGKEIVSLNRGVPQSGAPKSGSDCSINLKRHNKNLADYSVECVCTSRRYEINKLQIFRLRVPQDVLVLHSWTCNSPTSFTNCRHRHPIKTAVLVAISPIQVLLSLVCGIYTAAFLLGAYNPVTAFTETFSNYLVLPFLDPGKAAVVVFSCLMAGLIEMLERSGGAQGLANEIFKLASTAYHAASLTVCLSFAFFFDDFAIQSDPDLGTPSGEMLLSTKSGCPLNRGQIRLISYIGGKKSCP
eukprot:sb/3467335/